MYRTIGSGDDEFSIYASPAMGDTYHVVVYPDLPGSAQALDVPATAFKAFCRKCRGKIEATQLSGSTDLFISALNETAIRELNFLNKRSTRLSHAA